MKHRLIDQIMNRDVVKTLPDAPFKEVADLLARHAVSGVPVVDRDDKVLGVVSETDLMYRQAGQGDAPRPWYVPARRSNRRRARPHPVARPAHHRRARPGRRRHPHRRTPAPQRSPIAVRLAGRVDGVVSVTGHLGHQEDDAHLRPTEQALHGITEEWLRKT